MMGTGMKTSSKKEMGASASPFHYDENLFQKQWWRSLFWGSIILVFLLTSVVSLQLVLLAAIHLYHEPLTTTTNNTSSICLPGGGFSGFWYTYGSLAAIEHPEQYTYYCYSSGCACIAAWISNKSYEEVLNIALSTRNRWMNGELSRFDIVNEFIDELIPDDDDEDDMTVGSAMVREMMLENVRVLVTSYRTGPEVKQASNMSELREILSHTMAIPFITHWGMWSEGTDGGYYIDGAFSKYLHPKCQNRLNGSFDFEMLTDTFNPNLHPDKVRRYWEAGSNSARRLI